MSHSLSNSATNLLTHKKDVPASFDNIARRYDFATSLSQGYSVDLNRSVGLLQLHGDEYLLDLCCGTGKSTIHCLNALPNGRVLAVDNSAEMLAVACHNLGQKFSADRCQFVQQDVMELDLPDNSADAIFMAYGIRNMPDYKKCLVNLYRILKPGGILGIHEFSLPEGFFYEMYWRLLGYLLIIPFSALVTGNITIFNYLIKSVLRFLSPTELKDLLQLSGFNKVEIYHQKSWRRFILHTFIAQKPME
jgi:ubiquinone/menaquinone biosynthesis methyltransferase